MSNPAYKLVTPETPLFNTQLMWAIQDDLGEITDVELLPITDHKYYKYQLNYKSNGVLEQCCFSDFKTVLTCLHYVNELNNPIKKYIHLL